MKRAVFVDRDGVINRAVIRNGKPYPPASLEEFELLPGVESTMRELRAAGFVVVVVTNQPDVATGVQTREVVESMHERLRELDLCDAVKVCYHVDADSCDCRKPKPGMLLEAAAELEVNPRESFMIGDRWRDVAAGKAAGCYTFLVASDYHEQQAEDPDAIVASLEDAGKLILAAR